MKVFTGLWADKFLSVLLHFSAEPTESYFSVSFACERRSRGCDLLLSEPICWPASLFHVLLPHTRKDTHDGSLGGFILKLLLQMWDWRKENEKERKKAKLKQICQSKFKSVIFHIYAEFSFPSATVSPILHFILLQGVDFIFNIRHKCSDFQLRMSHLHCSRFLGPLFTGGTWL